MEVHRFPPHSPIPNLNDIEDCVIWKYYDPKNDDISWKDYNPKVFKKLVNEHNLSLTVLCKWRNAPNGDIMEGSVTDRQLTLRTDFSLLPSGLDYEYNGTFMLGDYINRAKVLQVQSFIPTADLIIRIKQLGNEAFCTSFHVNDDINLKMFKNYGHIAIKTRTSKLESVLKKNKINKLLFMGRVKYDLESCDPAPIHENIIELLAHKEYVWRKENEWRIFTYDKNHYNKCKQQYYLINIQVDELIDGVAIDPDIEGSKRKELIKYIKDKNLDVLNE